LVRMQFEARTASYRAQYPHARFDIVEDASVPIGRLILDGGAAGGEADTIVDVALVPERRGQGLGTALLAAALERFAREGRPVKAMVLAANTASRGMFRRL